MLQHSRFQEYRLILLSLFLIWTTTPWTIPLNRAVVLHPNAEYALVHIDESRAAFVGADLVEKLSTVLDRPLTVFGDGT